MTQRIFISYRRQDSRGDAGRIYDRLLPTFGETGLFMDVAHIPLGVNFVRVLREEVAKCHVLLAVIGPNWLEARDDDGSRRLDNPNDFVRVEIAAALARDIPVIPILLEGTKMPKAAALPADLHELAQELARLQPAEEKQVIQTNQFVSPPPLPKPWKVEKGARAVSPALSRNPDPQSFDGQPGSP